MDLLLEQDNSIGFHTNWTGWEQLKNVIYNQLKKDFFENKENQIYYKCNIKYDEYPYINTSKRDMVGIPSVFITFLRLSLNEGTLSYEFAGEMLIKLSEWNSQDSDNYMLMIEMTENVLIDFKQFLAKAVELKSDIEVY